MPHGICKKNVLEVISLILPCLGFIKFFGSSIKRVRFIEDIVEKSNEEDILISTYKERLEDARDARSEIIIETVLVLAGAIAGIAAIFL